MVWGFCDGSLSSGRGIRGEWGGEGLAMVVGNGGTTIVICRLTSFPSQIILTSQNSERVFGGVDAFGSRSRRMKDFVFGGFNADLSQDHSHLCEEESEIQENQNFFVSVFDLIHRYLVLQEEEFQSCEFYLLIGKRSTKNLPTKKKKKNEEDRRV
ncbi:hypothetical protein NE237_011061 [Protea cynaroides]|uniref:Uncharacterized protein n=1 Tax=Protea cynaroides TaxID=273540 RepID=A0A9Q0GX71_9MAGN|nr:hypothetical protein NE237_011061 [Protea cynaroides]